MSNRLVHAGVLVGVLTGLLLPAPAPAVVLSGSIRCKNESFGGSATSGSCNFTGSVSVTSSSHGGHADNCPPSKNCETLFSMSAGWTAGCVTKGELYKNGSILGQPVTFDGNDSGATGEVNWAAACGTTKDNYEFKFYGSDPTVPIATITFSAQCKECQKIP